MILYIWVEKKPTKTTYCFKVLRPRKEIYYENYGKGFFQFRGKG